MIAAPDNPAALNNFIFIFLLWVGNWSLAIRPLLWLDVSAMNDPMFSAEGEATTGTGPCRARFVLNRS